MESSEPIAMKYTVVAWDGKTMTFPSAICTLKDGEYIIEDLSQENVHIGFPQANIFYVKEEPCDE